VDETPFDRLERELESAARRAIAVAPGTRRRRRRSLGALGALLAVPALAATAWAASTLLTTGSAVVYRDGVPVSGVGVGAAVPGSVKMLTTSVPDPDGGLPWGLRSFRTTRGLVCLQVGRVYEGKLGVLGSAGSFGDDGRFHELRPGIVPNERYCFPPDGAGQAFLTFHFNDYLPSGEPCMTRSCSSLMSVGRPAAPPPTPSLAERRSIDFGLLGPKATRLTYRFGAHTRTMRPIGADGAYLVVQRPLAPRPVPQRFRNLPGFVNDDTTATMTPASRVVRSVRYGEAGACDVRSDSQFLQRHRTGGCPDPPGFVPIPQAEPGDVRSKVSARPVGENEIRVRFTARVAVRDRSSAYNVVVHPPASAGRCCRGATGDTTDRNIPAGRTIVKDIGLFRRKPGRYRIDVSLRTQSPHPSPGGNLQHEPLPGPSGKSRGPALLVGSTTVLVR
jgi:hypothetical protein